MPKITNAVASGGAASGKSKKKEAILGMIVRQTPPLQQTCRAHIFLATAFASDLRERLPIDKDDTAATQVLLSKVQQHIQSLERYSGKQQHGMLEDEDLETEGMKLWNVCTRLGRQNNVKSSAGPKLVLWSRVLAFQILHLCQWSVKCDFPTASRLSEVALRVAKLCIGL
jgi:hypothetical protein